MEIESKKNNTSEESQETHQLVCFKLGEEEYAFNITDLQEVVRMQDITSIPQMPDFVLGVVNLRGNIVSVFDLRKKLYLPDKENDEKTKMVVSKVNDSVFGMIVDEILDNILLEQSQIDPAPTVKMTINKECISGLAKLEGRLITMLNLEQIHEEIKEELGC